MDGKGTAVIFIWHFPAPYRPWLEGGRDEWDDGRFSGVGEVGSEKLTID